MATIAASITFQEYSQTTFRPEDDSYSDTQERADDYRAMGLKTIWIIDPKTRTGRMCVDHETIGDDLWIKAEVLVVPRTLIRVDLSELFRKLDQ